MAPHVTSRRIISTRRLWWTTPLTMHNRLTIYFNTYITPINNDYSIRFLTKHALGRIFCHLETLHIFENVNHFITKERKFRLTDDMDLIVSCNNCSLKISALNPSLNDKLLIMEGNQHFTFPKNMLYSLLEIAALWCDNCHIANFDWYTETDCIVCV